METDRWCARLRGKWSTKRINIFLYLEISCVISSKDILSAKIAEEDNEEYKL